MSPVTLLFALHNHQPDGNFGEVFQSGYDDCYQRIVQALEEAPHVRCALHHTGALLEWIERERPDYFARLRAVVGRGQVELLGGGFYEPMLAVLPERDALGQIAMMNDYCAQHFGAAPTGMWLAERVWEPGLPPLLARGGMRFTLIDDGHFRYAGEAGALHGYYATEKAGTPIAIFPIDQRLRYAIPFAPAHETIKTILDLGEQYGEGAVVTYGDDGEKFGMWPGTKEWVWDKGWLRDFFRLLGEHRDRIVTSTFSEVLATRPPSGRVYLPTASYEEMGEWALPAVAQRRYHEVRHALEDRRELEAARPFLRGGIWQGFLSKYPESNAMHKKMVQVSERVAEAAARAPERKDEIALATRELYRAQCNCSYWHGLFGGLYLNYLRDTVYRHLLVAEAFSDGVLGRPAPPWAPEPGAKISGVVTREVDVDADLENEIVIQSPGIDALLRPHQGGVLAELAYRPKTFMLTNVLSRHEEGYHQKLRDHEKKGAASDGGAPKSIHDVIKVKEPGLDKFLVYDRMPRSCFIDHFLPRDASLDQFAGAEPPELGDFAGARYRKISVENGVQLARTGKVSGRTVQLQKTYIAGASGIGVRYELTLLDGDDLETIFAPELSFTLLDGKSPERVYRLPDRDLSPDERLLQSRGAWRDVPSVALVNEANRFRLDLGFGAHRPSVWRFPLETVSMSEGGFERTYQGSVIVPLFAVKLTRSGERIAIDLAFSDL
jgi:alpha-amylase